MAMDLTHFTGFFWMKMLTSLLSFALTNACLLHAWGPKKYTVYAGRFSSISDIFSLRDESFC